MELPKRKPNRIPYFDYSTPGAYFVTICTEDRKHTLCSIVGDGFPVPKPPGQIAEDFIRKIPEKYPCVTIDHYVVMPNHVHAIIILEEGSPGLSAIVGQYKAAVTKHIHKWDPAATVWQTSFHDHIIRNLADYQRIWQYIDTNPVKWSEDCFYTP